MAACFDKRQPLATASQSQPRPNRDTTDRKDSSSVSEFLVLNESDDMLPSSVSRGFAEFNAELMQLLKDSDSNSGDEVCVPVAGSWQSIRDPSAQTPDTSGIQAQHFGSGLLSRNCPQTGAGIAETAQMQSPRKPATVGSNLYPPIGDGFGQHTCDRSHDSASDLVPNDSFYTLLTSSVPMTAMFLLDVLPSRVSLILLGQLSGDVFQFDALFLAYAFTNFWSVFVVSMSAGLDTLPKQLLLAKPQFLRIAALLMTCAFALYALVAAFSRQFLATIHQPPLLVRHSSLFIVILVPYGLCYVLFVALRKFILDVISTRFIVALMAVRLLIHALVCALLYSTTPLGVTSFAVADSLSMALLLISALYFAYHSSADSGSTHSLFRTLCNSLLFNSTNSKNRVLKCDSANSRCNRCLFSCRSIARRLMRCTFLRRKTSGTPLAKSDYRYVTESEERRPIMTTAVVQLSLLKTEHPNDDDRKLAEERKHEEKEKEEFSRKFPLLESTQQFETDSRIPSPLVEYLLATVIPGTISFLEWWAVESFTFLVGATRNSDTSTILTLFVHSCWSALQLVLQMPILALSVTTSATLSFYIYRANVDAARRTFYRSLVAALIYCASVCILLTLCSDYVLFVFVDSASVGGSANKASRNFAFRFRQLSHEIVPFWIVAFVGYAVSMCLLALFISVGRLSKGGTLMLVSYYAVGLVLAVVLAFGAGLGLVGVWIAMATAFAVWALLSASHWLFNDMKTEMLQMKRTRDLIERQHMKRGLSPPPIVRRGYRSTESTSPVQTTRY